MKQIFFHQTAAEDEMQPRAGGWDENHNKLERRNQIREKRRARISEKKSGFLEKVKIMKKVGILGKSENVEKRFRILKKNLNSEKKTWTEKEHSSHSKELRWNLWQKNAYFLHPFTGEITICF